MFSVIFLKLVVNGAEKLGIGDNCPKQNTGCPWIISGSVKILGLKKSAKLDWIGLLLVLNRSYMPCNKMMSKNRHIIDFLKFLPFYDIALCKDIKEENKTY